MMSFIKTTVIGGLVFLLPVTVLLMLLRKAFQTTQGLLDPLLQRFPSLSFGGIALATVITAVGMALVSFLAGILARTRPAQKAMSAVESNVLTRIPAYAMLRSSAHGWLGHHAPEDFHTALIRLGDAWQLGFVVDRLPDARTVVFIPAAPEAAAGSVLIVDPAAVELLDLPVPAALGCLKRYGAGASALRTPQTRKAAA